MNIYDKVQSVKKELLEANLKKSGKNKFANYSYYELSDFLPMLINLCDKHKLFTQVSFNNELSSLTIVNVEKPEETITYTSPIRELEIRGCNQIQALGGVETYSRRYLYMCAFDIVENDMFDGITNEKETAKVNKITKEQGDTLFNMLTSRNYTDDQIKKSLDKYKVKSIKELNTVQYEEIVNKIKGETQWKN